jgi:hypothetical protein
VSCLDENTIAAFAEGRLTPVELQAAEAHASSCTDCMEVLVAIGRSSIPQLASQEAGAAATAPALRTTMPSPGTHHAYTAACFTPGDFVAGRYRIVRFIARGGMGEVYEVEDLELQLHVALKAVRSQAPGDRKTIERFRREIQLARRVTHPNVCRIFDVGFHRIAIGGPDPLSAPIEEIAFLTMELLPGETLGHRIRRAGPLPVVDALPLVRDMAHALDAAHAAGVIHRDFKSDNVMLVPVDGGAVRAVVTDFGLARGTAMPEQALTTARSARAIAGTPAYMAPEQVEGEEVGAPADLYALGVVLYEMVSGTLPFVGETPLATAVKRLRAEPTSPRRLVPALDDHWEAAIMRCLSREPGQRLPSGKAVVEALESGKALAPWRRRRAVAATAAVAGVVLGLSSALARPAHAPVTTVVASAHAPTATHGPSAPVAIAVIGFENATGRLDLGYLSDEVAQMLSRQLGGTSGVRVIAGEEVALLRSELGLQGAGALDKQTLATIRDRSGADYVIGGSYGVGKKSGSVDLELRMQATGSAATVLDQSLDGTVDGLATLIVDADTAVCRRLGVKTPASQPAFASGAQLLAEGEGKLRVLDAIDARDTLEKAVAADAGNALAHAALAEAWWRLGYVDNAAREAEKAASLDAQLPREATLRVDAAVKESSGDLRGAEATRQSLWMWIPSVDNGVDFAAAQIEAGDATAALDTIKALRAMPDGTDPRVALCAAAADEFTADFRSEKADAALAMVAGQAEGAIFVLAAAELREAEALRRLGQPSDATAALEDARKTYAGAEDWAGEARALGQQAEILADQGQLKAASKAADQAQSLWQEIGASPEQARAEVDAAAIALASSDLDGVKPLTAQALELARQSGDMRTEARALEIAGGALARQGGETDAWQDLTQALGIWRQIGDGDGQSGAQCGLAALEEDEGDLASAEQSAEEALRDATNAGDLHAETAARLELGRLAWQGDDADAGAKALRDALDAAVGLGEGSTAAYCRLGLGELALADTAAPAGASDAKELSQKALVELAADGDVRGKAMALDLLARAHLAAGDVADAATAVSQAKAAAQATTDKIVQLAVEITEGQVTAANGATADASSLLSDADAQAERDGLSGLKLEAQIADALAKRDGGDPSAQRELNRLATQAKSSGYARLAREAEAPAPAPATAPSDLDQVFPP